MSRSVPDLPRTLWVGADAASIAWVEGPAHDTARIRLRAHATGGPLPVADLDLRKGGMLGVIACDALAHHWMQSPPQGAASMAELQAAATARCMQLFGGAPGEWVIRGDWQAGRPFLCAALPSSLCAAWEEAAHAGRFRLSIRTMFAAWLAQGAARLPDDGWFGLRCQGSLSLGHCRGGRLDCVRTMSADPGESSYAAQSRALDVVQAESARSAIEHTSPLRWLDLRLDGKPATVPATQVLPIDVPGRRPAGLDAAGDAGLCAWAGWALGRERG